MESIKKIQNLLTGSIFEVFERMYYIFSEQLKGTGGNYGVRATIDFGGSANGQIQILLSMGVAETMAKNMLNLQQDEIKLPIVADCVKESLNMICGNFLRKLDPSRVYDLSIPTFDLIPDDGDAGTEKNEHKVDLAFTTGSGNLRVVMISSDIP
jgi:CheY-specific phosphatase CheX